MSFKQITGAISNAVDRTNEVLAPEREDDTGWSNGLLFDWMLTNDSPIDNTGSFSEGMYDMTRQLGASRQGTNEAWNGMNRTYDSWSSGGLGAEFGSKGRALGIGGGEWNATNEDGSRTSHGYGFGAGVSQGRSGEHDLPLGSKLSYTGESYRGVGGNAYSFDQSGFTDMFGNEHGSASGYGIDGNYTPMGFNNVTAGVDSRFGTASGSVENIVLGQRGGSLEGGMADDGTLFGSASWSPGRTEVHDASGTVETRLGTSQASLGSYGTGPRYQANGMYDPNTGNMSGGAQWAGGGWKMTDGAISHDFASGASANASFGTIDTANDWRLDGGWNNETKNVEVDGAWNTGNTVENAQAGFNFGNGWGANASLGKYTDGNHFNGHGTFGRDGVHVNGDATFGGFDITDARASYGREGVWYNEAHVESFGTSNTVSGANLDIDGNGLSAGVDEVRAGGFQLNGATGRQDVGNVSTDYSVGHVSNDVLVRDAGVDINGDGLSAHAGLVDFGGIRVKDVATSTDFGGHASLDTRLGSFTNGNTIENAHMNLNGDGLSFGAEKVGALGMDINDASVNFQGPGGSHLDASMGTLHTGLGIEGLTGGINSDGVHLGAEHANYNVLQLKDVAASYGMDGIYQGDARLGEGAYNSFSGDNIAINANMDGLGISGDNIAYDYVRMQDFAANQSFGDGAVTTNVGFSEGSLGGGHADHLDFQTNGLSTSLAVENLNAHGLQMSDVNVGVGAGDAGVNVGASQLDVLNLDVGNAQYQTENMGLTGSGSVENANLDLLNLEGGNAALTWGGETVAGASGDLRASAGMDSGQSDWDLMNGKASGSFENARVGAQMNNASVNFLGSEVALPDMGFNAQATGQGNMDLLAGQASGNVSMAGSSVNFAGHEVELGEWAQASGSVDATRGAVSANVGGENGVGVDASIADGNLDLNLFGHEVDVDEAVGDAVDWVGDTASDAWDGAASLAGGAMSAVGSFFSGW